MKLLYMFLLCSLFSCKGAKSISIEPILASPKRIPVEHPETGRTSYRNTYVAHTPRCPADIQVLGYSGNQILLRIQGNISSSGFHKQKLHQISLHDNIIGDTLVLKYTINLKRIPGKASAHIQGYNYVTEKKYTVPKAIKKIQIELLEELINSNASAAHPKKLKELILWP